MMTITGKNPDGGLAEITWYVGQPFPQKFSEITRIYSIQADGDEMDVLIVLLRQWKGKTNAT